MITAARRVQSGELAEVLMALAQLQQNGDITHDQPVVRPVIEVLNRLQGGDHVHLAINNNFGPAVRTKVLSDGVETIQDAVKPHPGASLADLPAF